MLWWEISSSGGGFSLAIFQSAHQPAITIEMEENIGFPPGHPAPPMIPSLCAKRGPEVDSQGPDEGGDGDFQHYVASTRERELAHLEGTPLEARFALADWLEKGKPTGAVQGRVQRWLAEHGEKPEARYLLVAWLRRAESPGVVEEIALRWLAAHNTLWEASYPLRA